MITKLYSGKNFCREYCWNQLLSAVKFQRIFTNPFQNRPLFTLFQSFFYQPVFQHIGDFYVICFGKGEIFKYYEKAGHLQACAEEIETLLLEKIGAVGDARSEAERGFIQVP